MPQPHHPLLFRNHCHRRDPPPPTWSSCSGGKPLLLLSLLEVMKCYRRRVAGLWRVVVGRPAGLFSTYLSLSNLFFSLEKGARVSMQEKNEGVKENKMIYSRGLVWVS
ncbi:hypothetical protein Hanom_Chr08g00741931 [Helianthus anomalus]